MMKKNIIVLDFLDMIWYKLDTIQ